MKLFYMQMLKLFFYMQDYWLVFIIMLLATILIIGGITWIFNVETPDYNPNTPAIPS